MAIFALLLILPPVFSFLLIAGLLTAIVFFLTRDLPIEYGMAIIDSTTIDPLVVAAIQMQESSLNKVRRSRKYVGWHDRQRNIFTPSIKLSWQREAISRTDLAYELFLINEVWKSYGDQYRRRRYELSPMKGQFQKLPILRPQETAKISAHVTTSY